MGIFRKRSRSSSQLEDNDFSLWQRFREDFSQSSDLIERLGAWLGDSRGRLALFGLLTILAVVALMLVSILLFGVPQGAEKEFVQVGAGISVPFGTVALPGALL